MFLGIYVSVSAYLPITYLEKLGKERKLLVVTPEPETPSWPLWPRAPLTEMPEAKVGLAGNN